MTWSDQLRRGYGVRLSATVEGIPYVFAEPVRLTTGAAPAIPSGYTLSEALAVFDGASVSCEIDRETGVASGRAWDLVLGWDAVEAEGLNTALFKRPSLRASMTLTTSDPAADVFRVDTTEDWPASGGFYAGREYCTYSAKVASAFTGVTRGVAGEPHYHSPNSAGGYRDCTDTPMFWRGRRVTIYEHMVAPDGRMLDGTVGQGGTYSRQLWQGYVDATPSPSASGMVLRCLPLQRLAGQDLGGSASGEVLPSQDDTAILPWYAEDRVVFTVVYSGGTSGTAEITCGGREVGGPVSAWWQTVVYDLDDGLPSGWDAHADFGEFPEKLALWIEPPSGTDITDVHVDTGATWLFGQGQRSFGGGTGWVRYGARLQVGVSLDVAWGPLGWLPVDFTGEDWDSFTLPTSGSGLLESGEGVEFVSWDSVVETAASPGSRALRISGRQLGGGRLLNPWRDGGSLTMATGGAGPFGQVLRTVLESSGTGDRGTYDTLSNGFGLGVPEGLIDEASMSAYPLDRYTVVASDGRATLEDLMGGWLALHRRCLVLRRLDDGTVRLAVVGTTVPTSAVGATIDASDILLDTAEAPAILEPPTSVTVDRSVLGSDSKTIVHDMPRIQAEGARSWDLTAPAVTESEARSAAIDLIGLSDGASTWSVRIAPWVDVQVGDPVSIEAAHPMLYDWGTGGRAPASVAGLVVGHERSLYDWTQTITVLLPGGHLGTRYLCPTATIDTKTSSTVLVLEAGEGGYFAAGDVVTIYTPGDESSELTTALVDSVSTDTLTLDTAVPSWVAVGSRVTHGPHHSASTDQKTFQYVHEDSEWL